MNELDFESIFDGRYRLKREIARGGMCIILSAEHTYTGRTVAIKVPKPIRAAKVDELRLRILREARATELARHPNVVDVLDAGVSADGVPYVVMEMLEGRTLGGILTARAQLAIQETVEIGRQICNALVNAHARGVCHRDLNPNNIVIVRDLHGRETVKLIDFSIAALRDDVRPPSDTKITKLGEIVGTPEYMAPEQLLLKEGIDHRCDIYSAAVVLFECLTGAVPYSGDFGEVITKLATRPIPSARSLRSDVNPQLDEVLRRALAHEPSERHDDAASFELALVRATQGTGDVQALAASRAREAQPPQAPPPAEVSRVERDKLPTEPVPLAEQRRRHERQPYVAPVHVILSNGKTLDGRSEDISEGGLLVVVRQPCATGDRAQARFATPMSGRVVTVDVILRWVRDARGRSAAGLEFQSLPDPIRGEIAEYVRLMGRG